VIPRPNSDEYAEFYAGYVARVPDGDVIQLLHDQRQQLADLLRGVSEQQAEAYPAPGEWNIKEVIGHLNDGERVFSYRALRFSRKDLTPLAGFDQNDFVRESNFSARSLSDLLEEFDHLRAANVLMFKSLTPDMLSQRGIASENPITPRALVYIVAGHADGHIDSLRTVYLK
jgi:hypothetical protein